MTFPDFSETNVIVPDLFYKNEPESLYIGIMDNMLQWLPDV